MSSRDVLAIRIAQTIYGSITLTPKQAEASYRAADVAMDFIAQAKVARVEEPTEFGSIVRATCGPGLVGVLWQTTPLRGKHYWESETGAVCVWPELTDVEVLRVGIGDAQ